MSVVRYHLSLVLSCHTLTFFFVLVCTSSADGNCFFHCLETVGLGDSAAGLRKQVCDYMLASPDCKAVHQALYAGDETWEEHTMKMQKDGTCATTVEMVAAALLFKRPIVCYTQSVGTPVVDISATYSSVTNKVLPRGDTIYLLLHVIDSPNAQVAEITDLAHFCLLFFLESSTVKTHIRDTAEQCRERKRKREEVDMLSSINVIREMDGLSPLSLERDTVEIKRIMLEQNSAFRRP